MNDSNTPYNNGPEDSNQYGDGGYGNSNQNQNQTDAYGSQGIEQVGEDVQGSYMDNMGTAETVNQDKQE